MVCGFLLNNNKKCKNRIKGNNIACYKHILNFLDYKLFDIEIDIFTYDIKIQSDTDNIINNLDNYTKEELIIKINKLDKKIKKLSQINKSIDCSNNNYIYYKEFISIACHFCKIIFKIETRSYDLLGSSCNFYCHKCYSSKYINKKF